MTYNELSAWHLSLEKVKSLASYSIIKIKIDEFNKAFGEKIVGQTKQADIENYQVLRQKKGLSAGTVDQDIGKVKSMIYKAWDNDLVSGDTVKAFRKIKKTLKKGSDVRNRILSHDEFKLLTGNAKGFTRDVIIMGYYTGMRKSEILNLTWDKIDLKNQMIRLTAADTKDEEAGNIPICEPLKNMLMSLPNRVQGADNDNHVFVYRGKPVSDIRKGLKKACKGAGIVYGRFEKDGFIFHDLSHTFNTNMRRAGVQESVIMDITGHSTREMFDRYNTVDEADAKKASKTLEVFLASVDQTVDQEKNHTRKSKLPNGQKP